MSISFFEAVFDDVMLNPEGDTQVCCPFPHLTGTGQEYYETRPSAGVNLSKGIFHCFACNRGYSEVSFCQNYLNISYSGASKFLNMFHNKAKHIRTWKDKEENLRNIGPNAVLSNLHLSDEVIKQLHIGNYNPDAKEITIPITMCDYIIDEVTYRPGQIPKYIRQKNSMSGIPFPYDLWIKEKKKNTLICAGEKDMMIARTKGFNAISFTGGEQNVPKIFNTIFKGRKVYIVYDNDETGRNGARALATSLKANGAIPHIVDISNICVEPKEDLFDFFIKYNKTKKDLIEILNNTPEFTEKDYEVELQKTCPLMELAEATKPANIGRIVRSDIQVIATIENVFMSNALITGTKYKEDEEENATMQQGEKRTWTLDESNYKDLLYLIDSKLKEQQIDGYIKTELLKIPKKEKYINISKEDKITIYKAIVTDCFEETSDAKPLEFSAYSLNQKLENGERYTVTYKLVPHPQDGQKLIMIINNVEKSNNFLNTFEITDNVKQILKEFQPKDDEHFEEKFNDTINKVRGLVNANYNETLIQVIDLWYHTVLQFNIGKLKNIRGYLDVLVVGESRIGKSSTATKLQEVYKLGKIQSLAPSAATLAGLTGGSDKINGSFRTRAGLIPQQHKSAIIFEELSKCDLNILRALTDIRSSNKVRITRVNGVIEMPALVRTIYIANPRPQSGVYKPIASYPDGISVITELVGTPEDIARFDILAVFGFEAPKEIDPFYEPPTPYPDEYYQTRIRWIWSRKPEQIIITQQIYKYVVQKANELNKDYDSYIHIFGVEGWQKILRLAIAIAGYVCSTDETFQNIIVKEMHIDKAIQIMKNLYDNDVFKLRQYTLKQRNYTILNPNDLETFQKLYNEYPEIIEKLSSDGTTSKQTLLNSSAIPENQFSKVITSLVKSNFISFDNQYIKTNPKFNNAYVSIDKNIRLSTELGARKWHLN